MKLGTDKRQLSLILALGLATATALAWYQTYDSKQETIVIEVKKATSTHATSTTPANPDGAAASWSYSVPVVITKDVAVTRMEVAMNGAPPETLHHLAVMVMGEPDAVCSNGTHATTKEIFTVSRNNLEPMEFEEPYGVHLKAGSILQVEFMEHTRDMPHGPGGHYDDHTLVVTLHTDDLESRPVPLEFIRPRLDDTPCVPPSAHQAFAVPPGEAPFTRESQSAEDGRYVFQTDGLILNRGANFWPDKGGRSLVTLLNGKEVDRFEPVNLAKAWQFAIPNHHEPIPVKAGDVLTINAAYQNPFPTPVKDAAGMLGLYFAPTTKTY